MCHRFGLRVCSNHFISNFQAFVWFFRLSLGTNYKTSIWFSTWAHFIIGQMLNRIRESFESICKNLLNTDFVWPKRLCFLNYVFFRFSFLFASLHKLFRFFFCFSLAFFHLIATIQTKETISAGNRISKHISDKYLALFDSSHNSRKKIKFILFTRMAF